MFSKISGDFSKLHLIRMIFLRFRYNFMRFQTLFVKIQNWRLKSRLTRFHVTSYDFLWFLVISYDCILEFERSDLMIPVVNGPSQFIVKQTLTFCRLTSSEISSGATWIVSWRILSEGAIILYLSMFNSEIQN